MKRVCVLFLDGVGLGADDPLVNPFSAAAMPALQSLLDGRKLVAASAPLHTEHASLLALDAALGVAGLPQSASGQAVLLTGLNVPRLIGEHYGPKPNAAIRALLENGNLFSEIIKRGGEPALLNAYPPRYFESMNSGHRIPGSIPYAARAAGVRLRTADHLRHGLAFSADFTGEGWAAQPGFPPAPVYTAAEAGRMLADLSLGFPLSWFDYWLSDVAGHRFSLPEAVDLLERFDAVLAGLTSAWEDRDDLLVITSDHGNLEDLTTRRHTHNPVPLLLIGPQALREAFSANLVDLTGIAPAILNFLTINGDLRPEFSQEHAMPFQPEDLRMIMRQWATSVALVTAHEKGIDHGMTVSSFTSVSLEPPLVLVSLERSSRTQAMVAGSQRLAVCFLSIEQEALSRRFAERRSKNHNRFDGVEVLRTPAGLAVPIGCLAYLDCQVLEAYPAGTHVLYLARIDSGEELAIGEPLIYHQQSYRRMLS